ncbi:MAG: VCBS domain-containing protein, partial [SAR324 cluster bacterium]|nr:VCBS domain-containing protein [SAR324 cluster bacterium]
SITSEGGTNVTFTVTLNTIPIYDVTIPVYVSDSSEALVSVSGGSAADNITLTFNAGTSSAVTVTVTGQNDNLSDSDQPYWVILSEASSQDGDYQGINPQDVALTNTDDESGIPGFIITPPDNATTTESGQDRTFTIKLSAKPISDVTIPVYVSDSSEALLTGNVDNLTLTFTSSNFDTAQTITAIAQNDTVDDGDVSYTVFLMPAKSSDSRYNGLNPQDLGFVNVDDDTSSTYGFIITAPTSSASVSESNTGTASTFNVSLTTAPSQNVAINAYVSDDTEAEIETSASSGKANNKTLTFSAGSTSSITVSVFAKDESDNDSDQFFQVILLPASSSDNNYNGLDPQDLGFVNQDND